MVPAALHRVPAPCFFVARQPKAQGRIH